MEDTKIIDLYWQRSQSAIHETDRKYGSLCRSIAYSILANREDSEECVEDTYLAAWNSIPPQRPRSLKGLSGEAVPTYLHIPLSPPRGA